MKNKTIKFIGVVLITTFILSYLSSTALVSAAEEISAFDLETSDSKNIGMGVIQSESPIASTLQFNSNVSGAFTYLDFLGDEIPASEESVLETENSKLYYPVNMRYENYWNQEYLREFQTNYVRARNVSDQYGNYTVFLKTEQYELSVDEGCEIFVSDLTSEVLFDAKSKGIYQIWYNNIDIDIDIISPSDKIIIPVKYQLPTVVDGFGQPSLGKYFYFAVYETGTYRIYLETGDAIIKLTAEHHKPQNIKFDEAIYGGKEPSDPTFFDTVYLMDVFELDIKDLETVNKYLLDFEYGSPILRYFVEDSISSYPSIFDPGFNQILPSLTEGKIYIVIDNPDYFSWAEPGIAEADPLKYTMRFEQIEPTEHVIGENETINLAKSLGITARTFEIVNTSIVSFHFENLGTNSPDIYGGSGSYVLKIDEDKTRMASIPSEIFTGSNGTFSSALLEPGKYKIIFQHSGSMGPEYLHFYTESVDLKTLNVEDMDLSGNLPYNFTTLNFEDVTLPTWENYPNTYGATYPTGFNFSIDENFWNYGYNISIHTEKNLDLFNDYITPDLAVLWDADTSSFINYTEAIQPGNASKVPVKTDGNTNGDALIIGSYDKFDQIEVTLADPSDMDAFTWQYFQRSSGGQWIDFDISTHDFYDGTNTTTGSLNKSGTISWNPETITMTWEFFSADSHDTGDETPDTESEEYYLIRVKCDDWTAAIANITSVRLRKFVKIDFDIRSNLAFNIGTREEPVYYRSGPESDENFELASSYDQDGYRDTSHKIDKNYNSNDAILYFYATNIKQFDYNGTQWWETNYEPLDEKPLTFSVCVFQPEENYRQFIDYNISTNVPTTHSNQLNLSTLTSDKQYTINIPDKLTLYLNITNQTMFDWTQINVQFINASVESTKLILPAMYDLETAGIYTGAYNNGEWDLDLDGENMNASIEFGFITETVYLEFVIENTTDNAAIFKVFGGQFNYPMLTILAPPSTTNWALFGGIGAGVVVLIAVSVVIYKKKNPV